MANAFIVKVMPNANMPQGQHVVFQKLIQSSSDLSQRFEKIKQMIFEHDASSVIMKDTKGYRIETAEYRNLAYVRHNFGFHYNHEKNSIETQSAINKR